MRVDMPKTINMMKRQFSRIFTDVRIIEGTNQIYFSMSKYRNKMLSNIQLDLIFEKKNINYKNVKWCYLTNPKRKLVCEKVSNTDNLFKDIIKVMEFLEFDENYLDSIELIKENLLNDKPTKEQMEHMQWMKEAFAIRLGSSISMTSAGGGSKLTLQGIDNDSIGTTLVIY